MNRRFAKGEKVLRDIDGILFAGTIEAIRGNKVDVRYVDDGNLEKDVPIDEVHRSSENDDPDLVSPRSNSSRSSLPKPLMGLIEDDYEIRKAQMPTVFVHDNNNTDEAILLNGAENKLAAGGGLRALRYLK